MESKNINKMVTIELEKIKIFDLINMKEEIQIDLKDSDRYKLLMNNSIFIVYSELKLLIYNFNGKLLYTLKEFIMNCYFSQTEKYLVINMKKNKFNVKIIETLNFNDKLNLEIDFNIENYIYFYNQDKKFLVYNNLSKLSIYSDFKEIDELPIEKGSKIKVIEFNNEVFVILKINISQDLKNRTNCLKFIKLLNKKQVYNKKYENSDDIIIINNFDCSRLLIQSESFVDKSNQTYYGANKLELFNMETMKLKEVVTYNGYVHDCKFIPNSKGFVAISGKMPPHVVEYNENGNAVFLIQSQYCNVLEFSPNGKYLAIAGFKSLSGDINIFEVKTRKKIGECTSPFASLLKWTKCNSKIVTGIVFRLLKDNHEIRVYDIKGKNLLKNKLGENKLYEIDIFKGNENTSTEQKFDYIEFKNKNNVVSQSIKDDVISNYNKNGKPVVKKVEDNSCGIPGYKPPKVKKPKVKKK